jgi:ABC-type multidrug transport system ATPase subunit
VDLGARAGTAIGHLSGGQKKRASLANEIVSQPNLLFLDEVTSRLDEGADWEMMKLFRRMADGGMTIVCVTHTVANVEDFCHKIVILVNPGVLAFYGTAAEARRYFRVDKLGDVYRVLASRSDEEWRDQYQRSEECLHSHLTRALAEAHIAAASSGRRSLPETWRQLASWPAATEISYFPTARHWGWRRLKACWPAF